ncbi:MAG: Dabb family protein [Planctomycetota bacterium]|nr:Dabb family protein [Planctomycetota bacterium]
MTSKRAAYLVVVLALAAVAWTNGEEKAAQKSVLRHVVLFQFKDGTPPAKVKEIAVAFAALPSKIDTIVGFEWGTDVSVENKTKGFTHGFVVSFRDKAGRAVYLPHPAHQEFVKLVGPHLSDVLVFDYNTKE